MSWLTAGVRLFTQMEEDTSQPLSRAHEVVGQRPPAHLRLLGDREGGRSDEDSGPGCIKYPFRSISHRPSMGIGLPQPLDSARHVGKLLAAENPGPTLCCCAACASHEAHFASAPFWAPLAREAAPPCEGQPMRTEIIAQEGACGCFGPGVATLRSHEARSIRWSLVKGNHGPTSVSSA